MFQRFAVFYTPPEGDFAEFGANWLGWDSREGKTRSHPELPGFDIASLTATPRKYGFHGTLKAPFYLADGSTEDDLKNALTILAKELRPVPIDTVEIESHRGFVALRPTATAGQIEALRELALRIVQDLDIYRAPPSQAELTRRQASKLTERQKAYLKRWGYPYIGEEFQFHMTLSGQLPSEVAQALTASLEPVFENLIPKPLVIDALTLMGQDRDGMFHHVHRVALTG